MSSTKIIIVSLTFDRCAVNVGMAKALGCILDPRPGKLCTAFNASDTNINIIFDPAHMIKLIRNTFGEKRSFIDFNNEVVDFNYIEILLMLQESEIAHLGNKLKKEHVFFFRKKNECPVRYSATV